MYKNATKCNETLSKWCKNKHGASKIMDTLETYQQLNFDFKTAGEKRILNIYILEEWRNKAYDNAKMFKEKIKIRHDKRTQKWEFKQGDLVLSFNYCFKFSVGKLVYPGGVYDMRFKKFIAPEL
jgi:hypothetical protein